MMQLLANTLIPTPKGKLLIARPRTITPVAVAAMVRPSGGVIVTAAPFNSTRCAPLSMVTVSLMIGKGLTRLIGPDKGLKFIMSAPGFEFAMLIAFLSEPGPESLELVTVKTIGAPGAA